MGTAQPDTLMWEARTQPGRQSDLPHWAEPYAVPVLLAEPCTASEPAAGAVTWGLAARTVPRSVAHCAARRSR